MLKYIVLLSIVCFAVSEVRLDLTKNHHVDHRLLFEKHKAKVHGHLDKYDGTEKYFLNGAFSDGAYNTELAISTFDQFIWLPLQSCKNTNQGATQAPCSNNAYQCNAPCKGGSGTENYKFKTFVTNKYPIEVSKFDLGSDTLKFRHFSVPDVPVSLVKEMKNFAALRQKGVLGVGFADKKAAKYNTNLLTAMKAASVIKKEYFTYYVSDTENFVTFGVQDNYLSKFDFYNYTFENDNLCSDCGTDTWAQFSNKWALDIAAIELEQDNRDDKKQGTLDDQTKSTRMYGTKSKLVFNSLQHGYSFTKTRFDFVKQMLEDWNNVDTCKLTPAAVTKADGEQQHLICNCGESLDNLPTFKLTFGGQIKTKSTQLDQAWYLKPEQYARLEPAEQKCEIFFYTRDAFDAKAVKEWDSHIFAGRLFLKYFFTVFDQEYKAIRLSVSWQSPEPYHLDELTMILVLVFGFLSTIIIFAAINSILKPLPKTKVIQNQPQPARQMASPMYQQQPGVYYSQPQTSPILMSQGGQPIIQQGPFVQQQPGFQPQYVQMK